MEKTSFHQVYYLLWCPFASHCWYEHSLQMLEVLFRLFTTLSVPIRTSAIWKVNYRCAIC